MSDNEPARLPQWMNLYRDLFGQEGFRLKVSNSWAAANRDRLGWLRRGRALAKKDLMLAFKTATGEDVIVPAGERLERPMPHKDRIYAIDVVSSETVSVDL